MSSTVSGNMWYGVTNPTQRSDSLQARLVKTVKVHGGTARSGGSTNQFPMDQTVGCLWARALCVIAIDWVTGRLSPKLTFPDAKTV
ncbi:MAG: hypothetical protein GY934_22500 [Gammaproteobacteria bacterium]|nr:hypothetical protein [Gammaproteobacteria bacterium]